MLATHSQTKVCATMNFDQALAYLLSLGHETLTIKLGLRNTEILLQALGNPHQSFPAVQIAGTNGKGSTAVMLDSICRAAGVRVGLFTSPHLISITERIRIDGREISEQEFADLTQHVKQTAGELLARGELQTVPTFFEQVTAIALLAFREANVDLAILETGLGGRLDSTTAAGAEIVAITPIAMDHEEYLGRTLGEIAAEKAAIIRPGVSAVIAPQSEEALGVVAAWCRAVGVKPFHVNPEFHENITPGLPGRHQITNAATAIALARALRKHGFAISPDAITDGLQNAVHPGRLELWDGIPPILFDGAHNPAAATALRQYLDEFIRQPVTIVFGAMRDKRIDEIARILFPAAANIILTRLDNPRAATVDQLRLAVPSDFAAAKTHTAESVEAALRLARAITKPSSLILVTGSLYLIGAARQTFVAGDAAAD